MLELLGIRRRRPAKEKDMHPPKNETGYVAVMMEEPPKEKEERRRSPPEE